MPGAGLSSGLWAYLARGEVILEFIGWLGFVLIQLFYLPQIRKTLRTRDVQGLSLPAWVVLFLLSVDLAFSPLGIVLALALILLSVAALVVNLVTVLLDSERRALHDRLARTRVVHLEVP